MTSSNTSKPISKLSIQLIVSLIATVCLFTGQLKAQVGTWTPVTRLAPDLNNGVMLVMSDGTILCHSGSGGNLGDGTIWDRLTPDSTGSYVNGTWSQTAAMTQERYSFSSQVLKDGRVYAAGGEYGTDGTQNGWHGEIYNNVANTWTEATGSNANNVISDGSCQMLENGNVLQGLVDVPFPVHTVIYNPTTNAYTAGPSSLHGSNESMWLKLPDNSILFVDEDAQTSERFIPSLNQWVADGNVPVALYDPYGYECGPGWMLPDGRAFFIGGTTHTAFYTPSGTNAAGTWAAGPDVPNSYGMPDAPGVMMVNGKILFACSPQPTQQTEFATPTKFYEFNYLTNTFTAVAAPSTASTQAICQQYCMVDLPNGQVICSLDEDNTSAQYYIYTPVGAPLAAGKPTIGSLTRLTCTTYMITGHGFNGISEGSAFGDENECSSNYPLFRFKQGNRVYYSRSYNWNSTGVQRGVKNDTAYFQLPAAMTSGSYYLYAVANGIASDSILFTDSIPSLSSALNPPSICTGTAFTYTPTSTTAGATYTWTRASITGISNAAITTPQTANPNEVLVNTTSQPITVVYAYAVNGYGCNNDQNVSVVVNPKPTASFTASPTAACYLPDSVSFTNTTIAGSTYVWSFGDSDTGSAVNPVHPYTTGGTYSVKLVARSACGIDSVTRSNYIAITPPAAPAASSPVTTSCGGTATLTATQTGSDTLKWFNQPSGGTLLATGTTYVTPVLHASATYYVENYVASTPSLCPPASDAFGTGSNYNNDNFRSNVFNVHQACTLVSVVVYASGAGNRTIQLQDSAGNVLQSLVSNIANGTSTVTLNFPLTVGTGYQLGCGDNSTTTNLYRNETGAAFPYSDPSGYITITGNNVPDAVHFYFFYDWKLQGQNCISARTPVTVNISNGITLSANISEVSCFGGTNGSATITPSGGTPTYTYHWSNSQTTNPATNLAAGSYQLTVGDAGGCSVTATETVIQPTAALTGTAAATNATCNSYSNGSVTLTTTGGTTNYSYSWTGGSTNAGLTGVTAGTYSVTITDANLCTAIASATVGQPAAIVATPAVVNAGCGVSSTGSASVSATGGSGFYTYLWSNTLTSDTISNLPGGTYDVTVTDTHSCTATAAAVVNNSGSLTATPVTTPVSCYGTLTGSALVHVTGGTGTISYAWTGGSTDSSITNVAAGTYTVTVSDGAGCSSTVTEVVTQPDSIIIHLVASAACGASNGSVNANVSGGTTNYIYHWNTGASTPAIGGLAGGPYALTVTDAHTCTATAAVTITTNPSLVADLIASNVTCHGASNGSASATVTTGTSPFTYLWNTGGTGDHINNLTAGTYNVVITDSFGCHALDSVTVNQPSAIVIVINANQPTCNGQSTGSASLNVTGGASNYTYSWSTGSTNSSVSGLVPGDYPVTVLDGSGCSATANLVVSPISNVTVTTASISDSCFGGQDGIAQVSASGGSGTYTYHWSGGATSSSIGSLAAGSYAVTVSDNQGCSTTALVNVSEPAQIVVTTSATSATNGQNDGSATVSATGGTSPFNYSWSNSRSGPSIINLAPGIYTVTATDANGCQQVASDTVNNISGIADLTGSFSFNIYPNPARTEAIVAMQSIDGQTELRVKDILGRDLITRPISSTITVIDLAPFASGIYFIEVTVGTAHSTRKLVIDK